MTRTAGTELLVAAALLAAGCTRKPAAAEPAPEIVAIKAAGADLTRLRALATRCGATRARVQTIQSATFLIIGADDSLAVRDCFFQRAQADYRAHHPIRAWIEDRIG
jgi:hypothetical protein